MAQRHPQHVECRWLLRPRRRAEAPHHLFLRRGSPRDLRFRRQRCDAGGVRAGGPGRLSDRRRGGGRADARDPAEQRRGDRRGRDGRARHPRHGHRRSQRLQLDQGELQDRRRCNARRDQGARCAVAEAVGGVRRHHEPDRRPRRGRLTASSPPGHVGDAVHTTTVIIGGGQAGLAMSRCLSDRSIDHVVLERGEVANSWRTERWDSLRLLTPNWQCRLPSHTYEGDDPDGYMTMPEVIDFIATYAKEVAAPVQAHTVVTSVQRTDDGYYVTTDQGEWYCDAVVLATGAFNVPHIPAFAAAVPSSVATLSPLTYRNPSELEDGGVLVVGASASGVQIAYEIQSSGRPVTLAVGEHVRGP